MSDAAIKITPLSRPEHEYKVLVPAAIGDIEQPLALTERLWNSAAVRRLVILIVLAALWEAAKPLKSQARFVWIPVGLLGDKSVSQGAAILNAADPVAAMEQNVRTLT